MSKHFCIKILLQTIRALVLATLSLLLLSAAPAPAATISVTGSYPGGNNTFGGSATVTITSTFSNRSIFYSIDDSEPFIGGPLTYYGPFAITNNSVVRALAVNADDFTTEVAPSKDITIVPIYSLNVATPGGGSVTRSPKLSICGQNQPGICG